jgi:hypothetical protein
MNLEIHVAAKHSLKQSFTGMFIEYTVRVELLRVNKVGKTLLPGHSPSCAFQVVFE